jgi:hypothetical protein
MMQPFYRRTLIIPSISMLSCIVAPLSLQFLNS